MTEGVRVDPSLTALLRCGLRATPVRLGRLRWWELYQIAGKMRLDDA